MIKQPAGTCTEANSCLHSCHMLPTFVVWMMAITAMITAVYYNGKRTFLWYGYVPAGYEMSDLNTLKTQLTQYPEMIISAD